MLMLQRGQTFPTRFRGYDNHVKTSKDFKELHVKDDSVRRESPYGLDLQNGGWLSGDTGSLKLRDESTR